MKNIPSSLTEDKRCDSLPLVVLNNINIDDEIPLIVEKNNSSDVEAEGGLLSIHYPTTFPFLFYWRIAMIPKTVTQPKQKGK